MIVAGPGLLASTIGFIVWALWSHRHKLLRPSAALLLGVGGLLAIVLSEFGTSVLIAAFWLLFAARRLEFRPSDTMEQA